MSIVQLKDISNACMIAGLLLLIAAAIMYVKLDIDKAWHFLSGRGTKGKELKKHRKSYKKRKKDDKTTALTDALPGERNTYEENTERLQQEELEKCKETMLLQPEKDIFEIVYEITFIHTELI